ncbi:MAG: universal stress protein [Chloroflexaceae bacterium]|nr:universal stress protein [Chloroflexaceae bacterium]
MFEKILVAVDGSNQARKAVDVANNLAERYHSSVCLLHAYPKIADYIGSPAFEDMIEIRTMDGQELLQSMIHHMHTSVPVETQLLEGPPASAILEVAETEGFDLIIMGSRGHNPVVSLLMGSVSREVSQKAHCPVMVVH